MFIMQAIFSGRVRLGSDTWRVVPNGEPDLWFPPSRTNSYFEEMPVVRCLVNKSLSI